MGILYIIPTLENADKKERLNPVNMIVQGQRCTNDPGMLYVVNCPLRKLVLAMQAVTGHGVF